MAAGAWEMGEDGMEMSGREDTTDERNAKATVID